MKSVLLLCVIGIVYQLGFREGKSQADTTVRKAYLKGCEIGGQAPSLTPWPLCPRKADEYIQQGQHTKGNG